MLNCLAPGAITIWKELAQRFLAKYFSPTKTVKLRNNITTITQWENKYLYETLEKYKDFLRKYRYLDLFAWLQVHIFYNGLGVTNKSLVNAIVGGAFMSKTHEVAYELLK